MASNTCEPQAKQATASEVAQARIWPPFRPKPSKLREDTILAQTITQGQLGQVQPPAAGKATSEHYFQTPALGKTTPATGMPSGYLPVQRVAAELSNPAPATAPLNLLFSVNKASGAIETALVNPKQYYRITMRRKTRALLEAHYRKQRKKRPRKPRPQQQPCNRTRNEKGWFVREKKDSESNTATSKGDGDSALHQDL